MPETGDLHDDREFRTGGLRRALLERREMRYDLLTAGLVGLTIGAGLTYLLRRGPSGQRPFMPLMMGVSRRAGWAGRQAARLGGAGARWAANAGGDMLDRIPRDEIRDHVSEYVGRARDAIDEAVSRELHDLRRAARRQRKRFGL